MVITESIREGINIQSPDQHNIWLISGFSPRVWGGGGEEAVNVVARHFADSGFKVSSLHGVIYDRPPREEPLPDNLSLRQIPQSNLLDFKGFSMERSFIFRRLLQIEKPAFVVINMPSRIGLSAALALRDSTVPTTFWWHGTPIAYDTEYDYQYPSSKIRSLARKFIFNPLKRAAIRKIVEAANFNHAACSEFTATVLQNKGLLAPETAKVLNPATLVGLDNVPWVGSHLDGVRDDDLVVFIPSRVAPDKQFYNVRELISGFQTTSCTRRINFVSAGPPPSPEYLTYAFPQVETETIKTTYLGVLDRKGMERVYASADCVFMPSRVEPFGLSTIEGMRFGLPILGFNSGGTAEILREFPDYPHYLIGEGREQIRLDPVKAFLEVAPGQRFLGLNYRREVLERFDPKKLARQLLNFVTLNDRGVYKQVPSEI